MNPAEIIAKTRQELAGIGAAPGNDEALQILLAKNTDFFDREHYLQKYPDVVSSGMDPALHFIRHGFREGRQPAKWLEDGIIARIVAALNSNARFVDYLDNLDKFISGHYIQRQGSFEALYDMPLFINWMLTDMCNYHCSYCFGQKKIEKNRFVPFYKILNAVDNLAMLNRPVYDFIVTGGEPTIYPNFIDLLHILNSKFGERLSNLMIISNGSRDMEFYSQLNEIAQLFPIHLLISIHTDHVVPKHIYELIENADASIKLTFSLMYNPAKLDLVHEIFANMRALRETHNFNLGISILREPPDHNLPDKRYTPEHLEWREKALKTFADVARNSKAQSAYKSRYPVKMFHADATGNIITQADRGKQFVNGLFNFKNMYCAATHMARIEQDGRLKGAVCNVVKPKVNIYEKKGLQPEDFMELVQCSAPNCGCSANDVLMKFADKNEAEYYKKFVFDKQNKLLRNAG